MALNSVVMTSGGARSATTERFREILNAPRTPRNTDTDMPRDGDNRPITQESLEESNPDRVVTQGGGDTLARAEAEANANLAGGSSGSRTGDDASVSTSVVPVANVGCLLYTSPSPRDQRGSRMPSSA